MAMLLEAAASYPRRTSAKAKKRIDSVEVGNGFAVFVHSQRARISFGPAANKRRR